MTIIMRTDPENPSRESIEAAATVIKDGGIVVFPTETVYGLGANAYSSEACLKIFKAKERPPDNPLIVHISDLAMLGEVAARVPKELMNKLQAIWPGPVTVLLPKSDKIPDSVTGGSHLVAVRMPGYELTLAIIRSAGVPIAAPSANISTRPSITDSRHAMEEMDGKVDLILDCGATPQGLESTIIDISGSEPTLLRAGAMGVETLEQVFGRIRITDFARGLRESATPLAPGMKYRHYSPRKKLILAENSRMLLEISRDRSLKGKVVIIGSEEICRQSSLECVKLGSASNLDDIGRNLFSALRELDSLQCSIGIIEPFPESGKGLAIMNRIRKASSGIVKSAEEVPGILE